MRVRPVWAAQNRLAGELHVLVAHEECLPSRTVTPR
jgi:hypothetical protein